MEVDSPSESLFAFGWNIFLIGYAIATIIGAVLGHIARENRNGL